MVVWEKPVSAAIERIDQCVASAGVVRNVRSITAANLVVVYRSRSAGANLVKQTIAAILQKSAAPLANRMFVMAKFGSHLLARQAVCASQNDPASFR